MTYKRVSETQWEWQADGKSYSVRLFVETAKLIWSTWIETEGGPQFEPGTAQVFEAFMVNGSPEGYRPPKELVKEVLQQVETLRHISKKKRRSLKDWLS